MYETTNDKTKTITVYKSHEINRFFDPYKVCEILLVLTSHSMYHFDRSADWRIKVC